MTGSLSRTMLPIADLSLLPKRAIEIDVVGIEHGPVRLVGAKAVERLQLGPRQVPFPARKILEYKTANQLHLLTPHFFPGGTHATNPGVVAVRVTQIGTDHAIEDSLVT